MSDTPTTNPAPPPARRRGIGRLGAFRYSAVELLLTIILLFVATPFMQELPYGNLIEAGLVTLVMLSAVLAVGGRRKTLVVALLLVAPALLARWAIHVVNPQLVPPAIFQACSILFFGYITAHLLRFVLRAPRVDANILCAGISGYLMVGLLWASAYLLVARLSPGAFTIAAEPGLDGFNAFYFSFVTLCTVGYGDILPVSKVARMLATMEGLVGVLYIAVLISRLVAVYSTENRAPEPPSK